MTTNELISNVIILDGNGNPLKPNDIIYRNRFQSYLPHQIVRCQVRGTVHKTVGGYKFFRPWADCDIQFFARGDIRQHTNKGCQFQSEFIKEGMYAFPQLIPFNEECAFDFEYGDARSFAKALKEHLQIQEDEKAKQKEVGIELARKFFDFVYRNVEAVLDDAIYEFLDPENKFGTEICQKFNLETVREVLALGFRQKYGTDWQQEKGDKNEQHSRIAERLNAALNLTAPSGGEHGAETPKPRGAE